MVQAVVILLALTTVISNLIELSNLNSANPNFETKRAILVASSIIFGLIIVASFTSQILLKKQKKARKESNS